MTDIFYKNGEATCVSSQKIYGAIIATMKDIGAIGKDQKNTFDGYKFRGIDDVYNALQPAMIKNGIFVAPTLLEMVQEDRTSRKGEQMIHTSLKVQFTFYADDGSFIETVVPGEAADRSDKSINKAMSAAFKYACFQTFCIPVAEMKDADAESPEIGVRGRYNNQELNEPVDNMGDGLTRAQLNRIVKELDRIGMTQDVFENSIGKNIADLSKREASTFIDRLSRDEV